MESDTEADNSPSITQPRPLDGRDHLNLAEHRISVLPRRQPVDEQGRKQDEVTYRSTRYDPVAKRRTPRSVTLTTNSRLGLPTPADESVLLALLYHARRQSDFVEPRVHFTPYELFVLMRWSPNSRSYERFRNVLERLSALRLIYRNAWWDVSKRGFETEFSTGLIASYKLTRQTSGRRRKGEIPPSWIVWNPEFFASLQAGAVKRLNLREVFSLKLPVSQQMYRYLDKHFFYTPQVDIDLREFACGHVGLSENYDNGKLKSRLRPAIAELESIDFIEPAEERSRYRKVKPGVWRVRFQRPQPDTKDARTQDTPRLASASPLAAQLARRGVTPAVAARLVADHPADFIQQKISVLDWLLPQKHPSPPTNPSGFLVQSIRQQYSDPPGYQPAIRSQSAGRLRPDTTNSGSASPAHSPDAQRREQEQRIDDQLSKLSDSERDALEHEALAEHDAPLSRLYRKATGDETRAAIRRLIIRQHVARRLSGQTESPPEGGELSANHTGREQPRKRPK